MVGNAEQNMSWQQRVTRVFVELTDALVVDFDVVEFLQHVLDRTIELVAADDGGLMLAGRQGQLKLLTASSDEVGLLEQSVLHNRGFTPLWHPCSNPRARRRCTNTRIGRTVMATIRLT